jgi:hypothetical protein
MSAHAREGFFCMEVEGSALDPPHRTGSPAIATPDALEGPTRRGGHAEGAGRISPPRIDASSVPHAAPISFPPE